MSIRDTLARLGIDPKKSLGQNFMVEPAALEHIAEAADLAPTDAVLEIGAGLGALTDLLAARARRVVALEIDGRFIPPLEARFAGLPHVEIVQADVLEIDLAALLGDDSADYKAVGNLPYYITTAIVRRLLEDETPPRLLALTMQREVAERIVAGPGDMSLLAVSVQVYGGARIVGRLKPGNFYPRPQVESAIVCIRPHPEPLIFPARRAPFFRIVRAGFGQPRKQIKNSLAAGLHLEGDAVVNWLEAVGIDPRRRAETLSVQEWLALLHAAGEYLE
jgi:16S rRNA (adenine1518-N6/adenine1519-N6)-dimethyltransferase